MTEETPSRYDALLARLDIHFDGCPERSGERSFTRPLLAQAAAAIRELLAEVQDGQGAGGGWPCIHGAE